MIYQRRSAAIVAAAAVLGIASAAVMALSNRYLSKRAERANPPEGQFIEVQGVLLHYVASGAGPCVLFLHGNGSMVQDFECSGILATTAANSRVIAFDRPGYGHTSRPDNKSWTPENQAALIAEALGKLGIREAVVVGHSWGTLVALALATRYPEMVKGLVLASGYYFPTARLDIAMASAGAIPGLGTVLCHTVLPIISRSAWPAMIKNLFSPCAVPAKFSGFPKEMALRPSQLRASAEESAWMVPSTEGLSDRCRALSIPVAILCGAGDQVVDPGHSARLQGVIRGSTMRGVLFNGHMIHHTAPLAVSEAIEGVKQRSRIA
jgi:pimeloyl-ACP methyl ester carboxylesterase